MDTDALRVGLEAFRQLSTEILFLLVMVEFAGFALMVLFACDILAILLGVLTRKVAEHHLTIRPMAERLGIAPPYRRTDRNTLFAAFLRGLAASGRRPPPSPPRPPGP